MAAAESCCCSMPMALPAVCSTELQQHCCQHCSAQHQLTCLLLKMEHTHTHTRC
jgi:hypothetical protein